MWEKDIFLDCHPLPTQRERGASVPQFWDSFYLYVHPLTQNDQIWRGDTHGRKLALGVSHVSVQRGGVPVLPNFGRSFLFMYTPFYIEPPNKFGVVTHMKRGLFLRGHPRSSIPSGHGQSGPQLWRFFPFSSVSCFSHYVSHQWVNTQQSITQFSAPLTSSTKWTYNSKSI